MILSILFYPYSETIDSILVGEKFEMANGEDEGNDVGHRLPRTTQPGNFNLA